MIRMYSNVLISIFFTCVCTTIAFTQSSPCGTIPTKAERAQYLVQVDELSRQPLQRIYEDNTFKVIMYRLRESDGTGARSDQEFAEEINLLNTFYNPYDVCFSLTKIVNIDSTPFVQMNWYGDYVNSMNALSNAYPPFDDAVTIYVLPTALNPSVKGRAFGIPSSAFGMVSVEGWWNTGLAAHEMGHCFGLFHTHETAQNTSFELVTRDLGVTCFSDPAWQDCNVGGDALCDTPADFGFDFDINFVDSSTCTLLVTDSLDCHGNAYTPDPLNIMSYSPQWCVSSLSGQQVGKMHLTIDASLVFNNTQAPFDYNFGDANYASGYDHFLAKNSITIAPGSEYRVDGSAQVIHDAEGFIDLKPGFIATPQTSDGYFRARAKDLCNNDTTQLYAMPN